MHICSNFVAAVGLRWMPPKQCWKKVLNAKSAKVVNGILMALIGINFKGFDNLMQILCVILHNFQLDESKTR